MPSVCPKGVHTDAHRVRVQRSGDHGRRSIENENDRLLILANPVRIVQRQTARLHTPGRTFFPEHAGSVVFFLYVLGIAVAIGSAKLFRSTILPGEVSPFVMEMPPYHLPTVKTTLICTWSRGSMYLRKPVRSYLGRRYRLACIVPARC